MEVDVIHYQAGTGNSVVVHWQLSPNGLPMDGELVGAGSHSLIDQGCTYGAFTLDVKTVLKWKSRWHPRWHPMLNGP